MKVEFYGTFKKDIKKLTPDKKLIAKQIVSELKLMNIVELTNHPKITQMVGHNNAYRYKQGIYRLGFFITEIEEEVTVECARFLTRKDIYKLFP